MARTHTYVKTLALEPNQHKNIESRLDELILKETSTGATFRDITSSMDGDGYTLYTVVFERVT